jgi:hypothetical protein
VAEIAWSSIFKSFIVISWSTFLCIQPLAIMAALIGFSLRLPHISRSIGLMIILFLMIARLLSILRFVINIWMIITLCTVFWGIIVEWSFLHVHSLRMDLVATISAIRIIHPRIHFNILLKIIIIIIQFADYYFNNRYSSWPYTSLQFSLN